jgi:hypothetical protein
MKDTIISIVVSTAVLTGLGIIVGGSLYGCQQSRQAYYAAQTECVGHGGTWVPMNQYGNGAMCLNQRTGP